MAESKQGDGFERTEAMDAPKLLRQIVAAGGPQFELSEQLVGGAVGAWVVRWPDGHDGVLTWGAPLREDQPAGMFDRTVAMMSLAATAGVPLPTYEAVVPLDDGSMAIVQQRVLGTSPQVVTAKLLDEAIELAERRRGLIAGTPFEGETLDLYLRSDGPGFCLHQPLRSFSSETGALLDAIEGTVGEGDDWLPGPDVVHFDYHFGNVLVGPEDRDRVLAVIDWEGARPGRVELDLALLAFDLTWRAPGETQQRVEQHLIDTCDHDTFAKVWAHASLRLLDWTIRHHPADVDHWVGVASRHLLI